MTARDSLLDHFTDHARTREAWTTGGEHHLDAGRWYRHVRGCDRCMCEAVLGQPFSYVAQLYWIADMADTLRSEGLIARRQ